MAFFGLKLGLDLEMWVAYPHQKFQGVPTWEELTGPIASNRPIACKQKYLMDCYSRYNLG